jgi:hypothetical protein
MSASLHKPTAIRRLAGWKRLLPVTVVGTASGVSLHVRWRLLAWTFLALSGGGYVAAISAAYVFVKYHRGFTDVAYFDLLWPGRWSHYRIANGDYLVSRGEKQLAAGDWQGGFASLRAGVAKSPANARGRLLLHDLLLAGKRPDAAEQVLLGGIPQLQHDPEYLQALFGQLLQEQKDDAVRRLGEQILHDPGTPAAAKTVAALAAASAGYFRGNYDQAEAMVNEHGLALTHDGRLLTAQIEWDRGYHELALVQIRALAEDFPTSEACLVQLGAWLRTTGARDEYRRLCLLRRIANPDRAEPRVALLYALREDGDQAGLARETDALLRDFRQDQSALNTLAEFAANTGDFALARRIFDHCRATGLSWEAPAFLMVEARIVARDYRGGLDLARELLGDNPDWAKRYYTLFNSLQAIAYFGLHDDASARLYLENFLGQADLRADNLLAVAQRFVDVGAAPEARLTLEHAVRADPLNQAALTRLVSLELELNDLDALPADLIRLTAMRKPAADVLRTAAARLGSDLFLFSRERDAALAATQTVLARTGGPRGS